MNIALKIKRYHLEWLNFYCSMEVFIILYIYYIINLADINWIIDKISGDTFLMFLVK